MSTGVEMLTLAILVFLSASQSSEAIIHGEKAKAGQFPYTVALYIKDIFFCTATLIGPSTVLTAGHCVNVKGRLVNASWYHGIVGVVDRFSPEGTKIFFKSATPNPEFRVMPGYAANDLSVLTTTEPVKMSETIRPVCLASADTDLNEYKNATAAGWGRVLQNNEYRDPHHLRYVAQKIEKATKCAEELKDIYGTPKDLAFDKQICATEFLKDKEEDKIYGTCFGDSGGPLVNTKGEKDVQIGITSYGDGSECGKETSSFTRVSSYLNFIKQEAGPDAANICFE